MNDEKRADGGAVLSSDGLGVNAALVPCPFCGGESGYTVHEGSTSRWRDLHCAACGETVAEARNTVKSHEIPTDSTPLYLAGDEAWQAAGSYAQGLRELAESEGKRAVEYLDRSRKAEDEIERLRHACSRMRQDCQDAGDALAKSEIENERLLADHARDLALQQASYERELEAYVAIERERWEKAMRLTWNLIKPLRPPVTGTGSYARGFDEGVATALKALRDAIDG